MHTRPFWLSQGQVVVTLCSPMPWQSIGEPQPLWVLSLLRWTHCFPNTLTEHWVNKRCLDPERSREAERGPERLRKTQRCSERTKEAHVDSDFKSSSFSFFVRMHCVDKNAANLLTLGKTCAGMHVTHVVIGVSRLRHHDASKWTTKLRELR